ncbi:hypothetical protein TRIUR3_30512 [Triticum urartu]|uniref:Uncharacterized protein n=1 Tax=Triticum urartu TaxID=4572 RepID=M7YLB0_TRIUA|nr:hypothetical protein TRIUR3_30512 [Triticum urartu]
MSRYVMDKNFSARRREIYSAAHKAGTKVFLKSLKNHNKGVALDTMIQKING